MFSECNCEGLAELVHIENGSTATTTFNEKESAAMLGVNGVRKSADDVPSGEANLMRPGTLQVQDLLKGHKWRQWWSVGAAMLVYPWGSH